MGDRWCVAVPPPACARGGKPMQSNESLWPNMLNLNMVPMEALD
jgi:hypothetical protein